MPSREGGPYLCITFENAYDPVTKNSPCKINIFGMIAESDEFINGRSGAGKLGLISGYTFKNNKWYISQSPSILKEIQSEFIERVKNAYGVEIIKIKGGAETLHNLGIWGTWTLDQNKQWSIALVNIPKRLGYSGLAVAMELGVNRTEELFDQIISTFKLLKESSKTAEEKVETKYFWGEVCKTVPYTNLRFIEIDIHNFKPLKARLEETDYHEGENVFDGYTFTVNAGEKFELLAEEDHSSNPGSFILTELYSCPVILKGDTRQELSAPESTRYFYVVKGTDFYGPNFVIPNGGGRTYDGSKYGRYTLIITKK